MNIKFGTSGWRAIIGDGFTFPKVRLCVQALAEQVFKEKNHNKPVVVGFDTRFASDVLADQIARILANNGFEVRLSQRDVPTPAVAFQVLRAQAGAGVTVTASHNPFGYNGLKLFGPSGGAPSFEFLRAIESLCNVLTEADVATRPRAGAATLADKLVRREDFRSSYLKHVQSLVNPAVFKKRRLKVVVDPMNGTGRDYTASLLADLGCDVIEIRGERDPLFGGAGPDPIAESLAPLAAAVKKHKAHLGLATDGDADRFGVVDADGTFVTPNEILALLTRYVHRSRDWRGVVAKSVMTTHAVDAVARKYGLEIKETPVGFRHIGDLMRDADSVYPSKDGEFVVGAEESGGFTMRGHIPEKDGILAGAMIAEMTAASGATLRAQAKELHAEIGPFVSRRLNIGAPADALAALKDQLSTRPPMQVGGLHVHRIVDLDGYKFMFQNAGWLGIRFSSTEPLVRLYVEAPTEAQVDVLRKAGESLIAAAGRADGGRRRAAVAS